jgi:hypothetical protein
MYQNITKVWLKKDQRYNYYARFAPRYPDDELLVLEQYFASELGNDPSKALRIKKQILENGVGGNAIGSEIIDGKIKLFHLYVSGLKKEPVLTKEELLELVDKWFELVAAKVDQIVITNHNGKFSIGIE